MPRLQKGEVTSPVMIDQLRKKGIRVNHKWPREEILALYNQHFPTDAPVKNDRAVFDEIKMKIMDTVREIRALKINPNYRTRVRAIARKMENIARLAR